VKTMLTLVSSHTKNPRLPAPEAAGNGGQACKSV